MSDAEWEQSCWDGLRRDWEAEQIAIADAHDAQEHREQLHLAEGDPGTREYMNP